MIEFPDQLVTTLRRAKRVAVLTGAGISAESGIPTFRDAQTGFWARFRAEDLATVEAFERDPQLVWDWYAMRREMVQTAQPNAGHHALAAMARHIPTLTLITQNVDGLHEAAGSADVLELHGNIGRVKCFAEGTVVPETEWVLGDGVPRCPHCAALLRPDVVWFGEMLPQNTFRRAEKACREAEVVFSIGTSGLVPPAATLPLLAMAAGAIGVEINLDATYLSDQFDYTVRGPSGVILPALVRTVWAGNGAAETGSRS